MATSLAGGGPHGDGIASAHALVPTSNRAHEVRPRPPGRHFLQGSAPAWPLARLAVDPSATRGHVDVMGMARNHDEGPGVHEHRPAGIEGIEPPEGPPPEGDRDAWPGRRADRTIEAVEGRAAGDETTARGHLPFDVEPGNGGLPLHAPGQRKEEVDHPLLAAGDADDR